MPSEWLKSEHRLSSKDNVLDILIPSDDTNQITQTRLMALVRLPSLILIISRA